MSDTQSKMPIAVLISGNGSNLQALIDAQPNADYRIALVLSNKAEAKGLNRAEKAGIPTEILDHTRFDTRLAFDQAMIQILDQYQVEAIILAGFMRILTPEFTQHYLGKMLNIHPSLLPKYPGLNTHQRALESGDREHGLSIHFVTAELDGGPVILQAKVPVTEEDTEDTLSRKVQQQEHIAYPKVANWLANGSIELKDNQAWYRQQRLETPLILSEV